MKRSDFPVEKVTLNLFVGDAEKLRDHFPRQGASFIIRNLVRSYLKMVDENAAQKLKPLDITIDLKEMQ